MSFVFLDLTSLNHVNVHAQLALNLHLNSSKEILC
jgi:hypothetical protein